MDVFITVDDAFFNRTGLERVRVSWAGTKTVAGSTC